ncbi:HNH endonuclease [Hydrogenoanaerobacterium saccharovorans]|uniref:HNH endonuclease n=1 Tax=Hydrogenoanaerobacterium saccharovorans TaxID=474960 RepID=UPI0013BE8B2B|nr:HNH endonuclease signature motif containing protein [Hydrogenoanaerobacterium saccharovorans]
MQIENIYELPDFLDEYLVDVQKRTINKIETETIFEGIKHDYFEDVIIPENERKEVTIKRIIRYQRVVNELKKEHKYKCQLCGDTFLMDNGNYYCEAHHIKELSNNGTQDKTNVLILCPKHHRMFHYSKKMITITNDTENGKRVITIGNITYSYPVIL